MHLQENFLVLMTLIGKVVGSGLVATNDPVFGSDPVTNNGPVVGTDPVQMVPQVVKEILAGPLHNQRVVLIMEEKLESVVDLSNLLENVVEPTFLLRPPQEDRCRLEGDDQCAVYPFPSNCVVLAVVKSPSWWPLWSPPKDWSPQSVLLLTVAPSCEGKDFLGAPLLERTPSAALLCPFTQRGAHQNLTYGLWTWLPFASSQNLIKLGDWNPAVFNSAEKIFIDRFDDFEGKEVEVASNADDRPLFFQREDGEFDGTNYRMLQELSKWLNFNFSFIADAHWGERDENGTWTGMLGYLHRGEKDLVVNYITLTPERVEDFDISVTYHSEGFGLMLKVPPPLPRWQNLVYPYVLEMWAAVGAMLIIVGVFYHFLNNKDQESLFMNFLAVAQCLMNQSLRSIPKRWSIRCFLGLWFFSAWILAISYTCNLIAVLTVPVYPKKIETQKELADSDLRMCMVDYGEFVPEALAVSSDPTLSVLGAKMDLVPIIEPLPYMGEEGCIEKVLAGTHAHTETYAYMEIMYSDLGHGNSVYSLKKQLYEGNLAFLFRRGTPWKNKFNQGMQNIVEAGLVQKWYKDLMAEFEKGRREKGLSELQPLSIGHLQGPFLLLVLGFALALCLLASEKGLHAVRNREI